MQYPDIASASDDELQDFDRLIMLGAVHFGKLPAFVMHLEDEVLRELHRRGFVVIDDGSPEDMANARIRRLFPWEREKQSRPAAPESLQ